MLRAASVGAFICDNWKSNQEINRKLIIEALLIHDMGNIIKTNLDSSTMLTALEKKELNHWKNGQRILKEKYNNDEHLATFQIAKELGVSDKIFYILTHSGSSNLRKVIDSKNFNLGIVTYADLRCAPLHVVSVNERFDDVIKRYYKINHPLSNLEEVEKRRSLAIELESVLQTKTDLSLSDITDESIKDYIEKLSNYNFLA